MDIKEFSKQNRARSFESFPGSRDWTTSDWLVALMGEVGEGANIHKKIIRSDHDNNYDAAKSADVAFGKELADAFAYLDLVAESVGLDLEDLVVQKWNEVSERVGSIRRIGPGQPDGKARQGRVHMGGREGGKSLVMEGLRTARAASYDRLWAGDLAAACEFFGLDKARAGTDKTAVTVFSGGRRNGRTFAMQAPFAMKALMADEPNVEGVPEQFVRWRDHVHVNVGPLTATGVKAGPPVMSNGTLIRYGKRPHEIGVILNSAFPAKGWYVQEPFGERLFLYMDDNKFSAADEYDRVLWSSTRACRALRRPA